MANRHHNFEDLTPLRAPSIPPAVWAEIVVYREVEVDLRAIKGQPNLWADVYCLSDGHNNWYWPYITFSEGFGAVKKRVHFIQIGKASQILCAGWANVGALLVHASH